jgi:hypothetical protein
MQMTKWLEHVKAAKKSTKLTGYNQTKCNAESTRKIWIIKQEHKCRLCGNNNLMKVAVLFDQSRELTIFEADLLFMLFGQNRLPADYAGFHKCVAGQKFVESIVEIKTNQNG